MNPGAQAGSRAFVAMIAAMVLGVGAVGGYAAVRDSAAPLGQIVAIPAEGFTETEASTETDGAAVLRIESCTTWSDGLHVEGWVDPGAAAGGQLVIAVTGTGTGSAGQAVGVGFAYTAGLGHSVGTFRLTIPWAGPDARFAVVRPDSPPAAVPRTGPAVHCPAT